MTASPVVDLQVWRERARVVRGVDDSAAAPAAVSTALPAAEVAAASGATVLSMPAPAAPAGPVSPFGPVMAFGLVRRPAPAGGSALPRAVHAPHLDADGARDLPDGPPVLRVLPPVPAQRTAELSLEPAVTSSPTPRLRVVVDTRGSSVGPRR